MKHARLCLNTFPNAEKRVSNTPRNGVFLSNIEVFGNVVTVFFYIFLIETKTNKRTENKIVTIYHLRCPDIAV